MFSCNFFLEFGKGVMMITVYFILRLLS